MRADIERGHENTGGKSLVFGHTQLPVTAGIIAVVLVAVWFLVSPVPAILLAIFVLWDFTRFRKASVMYHSVTLGVMFTEEEKQAIKDNKLESTILLERTPDATQAAKVNRKEGLMAKVGVESDFSSLRIRHLMDGKKDTYRMATPLEAKNYEAELSNDILPLLKGYLTGNTVQTGELGKRTLEF